MNSRMMHVKTRKYKYGGIVLDLPTYMWPKRKEIAEFLFRKWLDKMLAQKGGKA